MAILNFQMPEKVVMIESTETYGKFEFSPLEPGFGTTIGNALRRILLSSLEGFAITSIKIDGVDHEFSSIEGVMEDVTDIVLNFKKVRLRQQVEDEISETVKVVAGDQTVFKAGDINKFLNNFQVLNPDLEICHMEPNVKLNIELTIGKGRGYVPAEENQLPNQPHGVIAIDSIHTPIVNVKYHSEPFRVEQKTDYDKLIIEVTTNGSISPKDALSEAAKILIRHFLLFSDEKISIEVERKSITEEFDESTLHMRQLLKTRLADLDLSVRALNCLKTADVETLGELVQYNKSDLIKFRNLGKKSLAELEDLVNSKQLEFGMNISKYKLDKD